VHQAIASGDSGAVAAGRSPSAAAMQPSSSLRLEGERYLTTEYFNEFGPKTSPCPASELIGSLHHHHAPTEHYQFDKVASGHHFYHPKDN
jgi:hypothetical protein